MKALLELIRNDDSLPMKVLIHSIEGIDTHWHDVVELLFVLEGSINLRIGEKRYILHAGDTILINKNEIHNTSKTSEDNILLLLQISTEYFYYHYPDFNRMIFNSDDFFVKDLNRNKNDIIKHHLAKIVWELNKKRKGYQLYVLSEVELLIAYLINNYNYILMDKDKMISRENELDRIQRILMFINKNIEEKITLKDIADNENLSIYYLSRLFKENTGITFQEYLNNLRLDKALNLLSINEKSIADIAFESGFSTIKTFNNFFKQALGITPTEYRKENPVIKRNDDVNISRTYLDVDRTAALTILYKYLYLDDKKSTYDNFEGLSESIKVNYNEKPIGYISHLKKLTTFSRASEGLRRSWQNQLEELQREIGFEYIRFHGIFCDDMMVCNLNEEGKIIYNWTYVDELLDFFRKVNIKPFIGLDFMPSEIKESDETAFFWWKANISGPRDIKLWTDLVDKFIKHCINRYGLTEVETWYFEVWNEPELEFVFWVGGKEKYFEFYKETVLTIKSISPNLKVGGPAISHQSSYDSTWIEDFIDYCIDNNLPLDFLSIHIYPESYASDSKVQELFSKLKDKVNPDELIDEWMELKRIYNDKDHTIKTLDFINMLLEERFTNIPELHVTEWNASANCRNYINDTSYVATYIVENTLQSIGKTNSLGYWTFTDLMEEMKAGITPFHGGFGLINNDGLKKPSYFAYYLLSKLGDCILQQGEDYIITKDGEDIQILAYNFAYFDDLFMQGDTSALSYLNRYNVFEAKKERVIDLSIDGICGKYKITRYTLNRENGSVFDEWVNIGSPENMTEEEITYLKGVARPKMEVETKDLVDSYNETIYVPVHGIELIILEKRM